MSAGDTTISIVVPLYNMEDRIGGTLASLARQTRLPDEVIVVDDASTDTGAARAESGLSQLAAMGVRRTELLRLPRNGGPSAARNSGLERARGGILAFLDADDQWREECCGEILRCMLTHSLDLLVLGFDTLPDRERFPDMAALRAEVAPLDADLYRLPRVTASAGNPAFFMGRACNVAVRRDAVGDERFAEGHHLNENIDFWYRVCKRLSGRGGTAARAGLLARPLIRYRISPDSLSHRPRTDWRTLSAPPSLDRFRHSDDRDDRRLCAMLGQRWLDYAMEALPDEAQRRAFCDAHGDLLAWFGIDLPRWRQGAA